MSNKHKKKHPDDAPVPETPETPPTTAEHAASDDGMPVADESEDD